MTIAILAHDSRKELALQFCTAYSAILSKNVVIATGTTGRMLAQTTGLPVHCYLSGKLGGVQQITSRVACVEVDLVLIFRVPLMVDASSLNEQNLLRLCDMHGVPIATNIATAEVLLRGLDQGDLDYRRAQTIAKKMLDDGLISVAEFNKLTAINRETFSPLFAEIMPKIP